MTEKQIQKLETTLIKFIERVSKGDTTSETEVQVLPEVVRELIKLHGF